MTTMPQREPDLPVRYDLRLLHALSLAITLLMTAASIAGLVYRSALYPTDEMLQGFLPTDVVNLVIGVPILLGSMVLTRRGKLLGLLIWPGALFFVFYNYLAYLLALPVNAAFLLSLLLVTLSIYTLAALLACIDGAAVLQRLAGAVPERLTGGIVAGLGLFFFLRVIAVLIGAVTSQTPVTDAERALHIADALLGPALIVGGVLLWQRRPFGYVAGLGLLFQTSMLFVGLIILLLVRPLLTAAPLSLLDILVVAVLSLICFVPLALFVRGVASAQVVPWKE